jgi:hypothetical protein
MELGKNKPATLLLILIIAASSILLIRPACSISKPSVPEFTVKYVDNSYNEPPIYGVDAYTGKTVLTQAGYHVQNKSVELIIKNQPYDSYRNENGSRVWLFYAVAEKGHFEQWTDNEWDGQTINLKTYESYPIGYVSSSDSEYTVIAYGLAGDNGTDTAYKYRSSTHYNTPPYYGYYDRTLENVSDGDQVDFRVHAIIGYSTRINETFSGPPIGLEPGESYHYYIFTGQSSDWSSTQTITIGENTQSTPAPTATPAQSPETNSDQSVSQLSVVFGFEWEKTAIVMLAVLVAASWVAIVVLWRKRGRN